MTDELLRAHSALLPESLRLPTTGVDELAVAGQKVVDGRVVLMRDEFSDVGAGAEEGGAQR
jgi:hypothetical protein